MTNQCNLRDSGQSVQHGKKNQSNFLERLVHKSPIEQAIATVAVSYERVKHVVPQQIRVFIEAVEATVVFVLGRLISIILALPLPFEAVDAFALQGLDIFERFVECIKHTVERLRKLISGEEILTNERDYFGMLLRFEDETRKLAMGELRATVHAFLDTQIGLFDRIDVAIESFYRIWPYKAGATVFDGSELTEEGSSSFKQIKQTFEDVMKQKDILTWTHGGRNPLDPVWDYLCTLSQALTPDEATLQHFSKQIYFMRVVLRTTIEQIKKAATNSETSSMGAQVKSASRLIHPTWLSHFAIQIVERITGYKVNCSVHRTPPTIQNETVKESPPQTDTESASDTAPVAENANEITLNHETLPCNQSSDNDATIVDESNSAKVLEVVQEAPVENEENSDQRPQRAPENSSGASSDENPGELSRAGRRRRKKSLNYSES